MRSLIRPGAITLAVCALAACGGGGGGKNQPSVRTIRGSHVVFQAPFAWHVRRRGNEFAAFPKPIAPELMSVSVFPLLHAYRPALFAAVRRELDGAARQLATRLRGHVVSSATTIVAGIRSRQYVLFYSSGAHDFRERITFVLRGKTEFQLLCRWDASKAEPDYCRQLTRSFTPV
jgi:hypothetical protein